MPPNGLETVTKQKMGGPDDIGTITIMLSND